MFINSVVVAGFIGVVFKVSMALDAKRCVFPNGVLNGRCGECPVDTLYEFVESYSYHANNLDDWYTRKIIRKDQSYHKCVEACSSKYPIVGPDRVCVSSCSGKEMVIGDRKFCKNESINNGFCIRNECLKHKFKCFYMECFRRCPAFTVIYNYSCVVECFEEKPYIFNGECVNECPERYVLDDKICQKTCSNGRILFNTTCVDKCPESKEYVDKQQCVSECPLQKLYQDKMCVENCSEVFVLDGRICRTKCPSDLFEHNKICVDICPNHTFVEDKKCVDICSSGFYKYKSYCVDTCPPDNFIDESNNLCVKNCNGSKYHLKKNIFCLDKCPENMAEVNLTCVNQCPQNQPFFHQGSCLADCPVSDRYFEKKREPGNKPTYTCVNKCKKYTSSMSNMCVDACSSEQVLFREVCQEQCPASDPYKVHLPANLQEETTFMSITNLKRPINAFVICEKACPSNFVRDNEDCYVECPIDKKSMIYNMTCFQHCPDEYPFVIKENSRSICTNSCKKLHFQQECLDKCPHSHSSIHRGECVQCNQIGMYEENHHCVNSCKVVQFEKRCYDTCPSAAKFVYNGSCVRTCPSNANKVDKRRYDKYTIFVCIDSCPTDKYIFGNKCVSSCPNPNTAIYKNECVQCSKLGMYTDNQHCVNSCTVVQYENRCYNSCPQTNKFMYNGTCLHSCPSNAKKVDEQHHEPNNVFVCMETCPSEKYTFGNNCVSSCPDRKRLPVNGECMACHEVGKYDDGSKCVDMCQNLHYEYRCVDYCPTYPTYFKIFNKTCVRNCPKTAPIRSFKYNYITKRNDYRCLTNCPIGTYLKENKCVTWCETDYFILSKLCVKKCPVDAPYISSDYVQNTYNKECSKFCKESDYLLNFTCMEKCPKGFFGHDKQCLQKCPIDFPYISQDNVCVKRCNTLRRGMNCFDKCPRKTFQYNQTCVQNCPFSKPYNFKGNCVDICSHFLMKKTCYKQCPSGLVGYQKKCHLQCPFKARYKYKWECIPQCPKNTLLGFIKYTCFDTCPQGEFKYLQKCVELCPKDAPYDFNGECVKYCAGYLDGFSCYKQCPDKMFAFTGKCIPKCPEEAPFVNIKNCVRTCPYVHDSQLNCMKDCPEQTYPHGKQCKAGCPPDRPFSGLFFDPKCVEKCDNYELATENNKCISRSSCSTFIYGMRCLSKCPSHTYLLYSKDEKICKSLISVYFMMCILSLIVVIAVAFVIRVVYHCCKMLGDEKRQIVSSEKLDCDDEPSLSEIIECSLVFIFNRQ